jgi:hypothetical protein
LVLAFESLLVDLVLLGADEGAFVDVGVDFDVGVVAQLERVLGSSALRFSLVGGGRVGRKLILDLKRLIYPFAVVNRHLEDLGSRLL